MSIPGCQLDYIHNLTTSQASGYTREGFNPDDFVFVLLFKLNLSHTFCWQAI